MAGYTKDREKNYEIKYLRKVMGQVDKRVQVPESVSADSLRHLLDSVEAPSVRETTARRPLRLSLQSGIAYAAAFALIVALFYSTKLYRPAVISGGMDISTAAQQPADAVPQAAPANSEMLESDSQTPLVAAEAADAPVADPIALDDAGAEETTGTEDIQPHAQQFGVGGSGHANLVLERDEYAFYWRENDLSDPDRASPISFEVVDTVTQETITQTDVPLIAVTQSFELDSGIVLIGNDLSGEATICSYNIADDGAFVEDVFTQDGELIGAAVHDSTLHIVSLSAASEAGQGAALLPNSISGEVCVITAFDVETQAVVTKQFIGANGTVQLDDSGAHIRYTGQDENGEDQEYVAQILFDGMDITLAQD